MMHMHRQAQGASLAHAAAFERELTEEDVQHQRSCLPLAGCVVADELDHLTPVLDLRTR